MDVLIILLSLSCIVLFTYRISLVRNFLTALKYAKRNEFINYDHLFHIEDALNIVAGILVCVATIRLWKLLRFARIFVKMERIILYSIVPLAALFFCQIVLILSFALCGYMMFGNQSSYFKGIWVSICSLFYISLNLYKRFDYSVLSATRGFLGDIYYILFMFTTFTIYTLYVTAIIIGCEMSENYFSNKMQAYTVQDLLKEEVSYFVGLFKVRIEKERLRGGGEDEEIKVYPKEDSIRYGHFTKISLGKLDAMRAITRAVLHNLGKQRKPDFEIMHDLVLRMRASEVASEEEEIFLITNDGDKTKLIDDKVLVEMEKIVRKLTQNQKKEQVIENAPSCIQTLNHISQSLNVILNIFKHINIINK